MDVYHAGRIFLVCFLFLVSVLGWTGLDWTGWVIGAFFSLGSFLFSVTPSVVWGFGYVLGGRVCFVL